MTELGEEEEEEEETSCSRDHTAKKGAHVYHPSMMWCSWSFGGVVHNSPRVARIFRWDECVVRNSPIVAHIFGEMSRVLLQGHELLRLELPTVETLLAARKLSAGVLESLYTWFLSGPPDDPTSIHKSESKSEWVEGSSPYLSLNQLL